MTWLTPSRKLCIETIDGLRDSDWRVLVLRPMAALEAKEVVEPRVRAGKLVSLVVFAAV